MNLKKPDRIGLVESAFCPGCGHGLVLRLIGEALEKLNVSEKFVMAVDVACISTGLRTLGYDCITAAHGRTIAVASGFKRVRPECVVCANLGDGAAYSIGTAELVHTALRNENIVAIVVNNTVYGMTGGQMAPTSLPGEKTASSRRGKDPAKYGTLNVVDILGKMDIAYLARGELYDTASIIKTGKMIEKAFRNQLEGKGFSLVEVLSPCPTNLHLSPLDTKEFMHSEATKYFPLGEFIG